MKDARKLSTFPPWSRVSLLQGGCVSAGVVLFIIAYNTQDVAVKFFLFLVTGVVVAFCVRAFLHRTQEVSVGEQGLKDSEGKKRTVKKLLFDDFQASGSQYKIQFIEEETLCHENTDDQTPQPQSTTLKVQKQKTVEWDVTAFCEDAQNLANGGPKAEFHTLAMRILSVVKEVCFAHTVGLFWVNREKQQLVLESAVTDSQVFMSQQRLTIGTDYVSQVALYGKPILVNYFSEVSQADILPYYTKHETVQSFLGIPVFYPTEVQQQLSANPIAVLCIDCRENDVYGNETIALLSHVAKLFSTLLVGYISKYDLLLDSEVLQSISRFRKQLEREFTVPTATRALVEETARLIPWDYVTVVLHDDTRKEWIVQHVLNRMNDSYVPLLSAVDLEQSIVGRGIQSGELIVRGDVRTLDRSRFYPAERCSSEGSLVVVPINSLTRCYGALVVECKEREVYSTQEISLIQKFVQEASWAFEVLSLQEITNKYLALDETTGVATRKAFLERLHEEVQRANDFGTELSLVMVAVDNMDEHINRHGYEAFEVVLQTVSRIVKNAVRPYDVVGRFDYNCFVILLISTTLNEASLWAEKIKKNVASSIVNIATKNFSVTVSVGIAGAYENLSDVDLLENATRALTKAQGAGGNVIRVF
ncbi:MAG: diguanylate cyclase [Bacteroidetes bacterium]|nr:diguanylate cyclase [Bacteroidota bacterium]